MSGISCVCKESTAVNFRPTTPEGGKSDVQHPATTGEPTITARGWKVGREALASPQLPAHLTQSMVGSYRIDKKCKLNSLLSWPGKEERARSLQSLLSHWWQGEESALPPSKPFLFLSACYSRGWYLFQFVYLTE